MKKILLVTVMLMSAFFFGQAYKITNNTFHTVIKTGTGEEIPVRFELSGNFTNTDKYKRFLQDQELIKLNMEKRGMADAETVFLFSEVNNAVAATKLKLKNKTSFTVTPGTTGEIRTDEAGMVIILPFTAKNDYGQDMTKRSKVQNNNVILLD